MAMTDRSVKAKLVVDKINTELDARYVADGHTLMQPVNTGWRWSEEQEAQDMSSSTWTSRTARAVKDIDNSCNKTLQCTVETCEAPYPGHKHLDGGKKSAQYIL